MTELSREPSNVDFSDLSKDGLLMLMNRGSYRWLIIHERGYYLVNPNQGSVLYRDVVRRFEEFLNIESEQHIDQENFEWPGKTRQFPVGPAWVPWASQEVQRPVQDMPDRYFMAIFDLYSWKEWRQSDYYDSERF